MNRRDYRAHVEWAEGIKTARTLAPARPVHHVTRKPAPRKPRRWLLALFVGGAA